MFSFDARTKSLVSTLDSRSSNISSGDLTVSSLEYKKEMRDQFFVIQTPISSDTIYNIAYELFTYQTENCNSCFLIPSKKLKVIAFRDFSYYYKGQQYFNDTLTIYK